MRVFETTATVRPEGEIQLSGVPFAPGTEVEVSVSEKRKSSEAFVAAWNRVCGELRDEPHLRAISDDEIEGEISAYRAGR
jgi:hypothetical protein